MQVVGTTVNMGDGGRSTDINNSSSIGDLNNQPTLENVESFNTTAYQTNNTNNTYDIEELDLSLDEQETTPVSSEIGTVESVEQPDDRSFLTKVGDWFVQAGKDIYNTGAKVVNDVKTWWSENMLGVGASLSETAANFVHDAGTLVSKIGSIFVDGFLTGISTAAVFLTSVVSGVGKLVEHIVDGAMWVEGKLGHGLAWLIGSGIGLIDEDAGNSVKKWGEDWEKASKEAIQFDAVGEFNKWLYEKTPASWVNEHSLLKYDSKAAKTIQGVSEKIAVFVAATAATVCTGGGAAAVVYPLLYGFMYGAGEKAERLYQEKGIDTTAREEFGVALAGVAGAANWYAQGKLGQGALGAYGALKELGFKKAGGLLVNSAKSILHKSPKEIGKGIVNLFKGTFNKTNLSRAASKSIRDLNNIFESVGIVADDVARWVNGDEKFTVQNVLKACGQLGLTWVANVGFDALSEYFIKAKRIDDIPGMSEKQTQNVEDIFEREHKIAQGEYIDSFGTYREHAELHTQAVRDYAVMLGLDVDGLDDKALAEIYYGGYFHDLGMAGEGVDDLGRAYGINYNKKTHEFTGWLDELGPDDVKAGETLSKTAGDTARANHPLNSALSVLYGDVVPEGLDKDRIALLALSHSKSTSGVTSFADSTQWLAAVDQLEDAVNQYNLRNGLTGDAAIIFDADRMRHMITSEPDDFKKFVDQALCIRDGDAMSDVALRNGHTLMQTGDEAIVTSPRYDYDSPISLDKEIADISDEVVNPNGEHVMDVTDEFGKKFHAGEENVNFDSIYDGRNYEGRVELRDPHKVPNSSIFNIEERLGEAVTYSNCDSRSFTIELPKDMQGTPMGQMYMDQLSDFGSEKISDARALLKGGKISQGQFDSIVKFYTQEVHIEGYGNLHIDME